MRRLRMHDSAFKAKVAFEAAKGDKTVAEIVAYTVGLIAGFAVAILSR